MSTVTNELTVASFNSKLYQTLKNTPNSQGTLNFCFFFLSNCSFLSSAGWPKARVAGDNKLTKLGLYVGRYPNHGAE